jgi:hypothetical protein
MRTPEDPTRDPASEARDDWEQLCQPLTDEERRENARKIESLSVPDRFALMFSHASEPRATPETDAAAFAVEHRGINNGWNTEQVFASHARKLERQRDELLEALERIARNPGDCDFETGFTSGHIARAAIAAVKGVNG